MLLRRLELYGFKSFAKRTKLEFGPGITAIVGPNGSGKSNIADAIRWVLGEQRLKSLRSDRSEDLIFAGSDKRRSLGYGEVVLVLDNSSGTLPLDYTEVEISRRVYRSGEGEFRLNRTQCRLKDIQELFLDTGVGRDAYALISQGQVEHLLTMGPEERRFLLEEAAGVLKYRYRKREIVRKLEDAEQNILRVGDLLAELEQQLPLLEKEARREQLYRQYSEELKIGQISLALHDLDRLQKRRKEGLVQLQEEQNRKQDLETKLQSTGAEIEEKELAAQLCQERISEEQQALAALQTRSGRIEESISLREERVELLREEQQKRQKQRELRAEKMTESIRRKEAAQVKLDCLQQEASRIQKDLGAAEEAVNQCRKALQQREKGLEAYRDEAIEAMRLQAELKNKWQLLNTRRESTEQRRMQLGQQGQELQREISALRKRYKVLEEEQQGWADTRAEAERVLEAREKERERIRAEVEVMQREHRSKQREWEGVSARHKFLRDLERGLEGYHRGVRTILKGLGKGVCGTVAALIHVEKDLEQAIGVALGSTLQFLVVENDVVAQRAIEFLQAQKGGRATFLPLNTIRGASLPNRGQALLNLPGVVGRAADLVTTEPRFRPVVENLLGRVIVAKDLATARTIAGKGSFRFKIVTLNGEIIAPGGAITGGTLAHNQIELLSRKRELQELAHQQAALDREVRVLAESVESGLTRLEEIDSQMDCGREEIKQADLKLGEIEGELRGLAGEIKKDRDALVTIKWEEETAQESLQELEQQIGLQGQELGRLQEEGEGLQEKIRGLEAGLAEDKEEEARRQEKVTALKVQIASLTQQIKAQRDYLGQLEYRYLEMEKTKAEEEEELNRLQGEQAVLEEKLAADRITLDMLRREEALLKQRVEELREEKAEGQERQAELRRKVKAQQETIAAAGERIHQLEKNLTKLVTSVEEIERRLFEDYGLTVDKAEQYRQRAFPVSQWRRRVSELREELAQFGNVNLRAGEQYRELQERYEFLHQQRQDLVEARRSLDKLLLEIDTISSERLKKAFGEVQDSFQRVFQELFGGGKAHLHFTTEENLLEAGLEIMVQPPGKKLQNLLLLSGGEKALAAIAFLFGILQVKPSPFCVLDEIDASLDDANAVRLGEFLRRYANNIQFLLITHRQEIIRQADVLYGITMDDSGVSQFLSLNIGDTRVG